MNAAAANDSAAPMSLQEARRVPWLRSRPRPLGDLLDEGYLDASRLEWAAARAWNPRLKEAARTILAAEQGQEVARPRSPAGAASSGDGTEAIQLGITLEEARSTPWPFGALKGQPMGMLSETRRVSLKDLAYLIENAWEDRVRRAATALMASRLGQDVTEPPTPAGMIHVVAGKRSYAERRQLSLAFLEGAIGGVLFGISLSYLVATLARQRTAAHPRITLADILSSNESVVAFAIVVGIMAAIAIVVLLGPHVLFKRIDQSIEAYRRGEEGEEKVIERARQALDGTWSLFRNIVLPGRRLADLDIVLVGPPGVWALEVKALAGKYKNVGDAWGYRAGNRWKRMSKNPTRQARNGAIALAEFLRADGIKTYVSPALAWANEEGQIFVQDPIVPVWTIDRLEDELGNLSNGQRLEATAQERIIEKLTRLCGARNNGPW